MQIITTEAVTPLALVTPISPSPFDRDAPTARMYLTSRPKSFTAKAFIATLAANIIELQGACKAASPEYTMALGAMIAELLRAAAYMPPRACFRPLKTTSFTDCAVGHRPFTRALDDMCRHGFVTMKRGESAWGTREGTVTRVRLTPRLTHRLAANGITVANRYGHFDYQLAMNDVPPVQLRAATAKEWPRVFRGRKMRVDFSHPAVCLHAKQIRRINDYLSKQTVVDHDGATLDIALRRVFNLGDMPDHNFMKGGRAYDGYQSVTKENRKLFTINEQKTIEVDISACFLTLLHFLLARPFSAAIDPYAGPSFPRPVTKAWVNLTIGHSNYHNRWPPEALEKLAEKGHPDVKERYKIRRVRDEVLQHMPIVKEWVESPFTWADLFRLESQIMLDATDRLAHQYDIPALPIHDALKVPICNAAIVKNVIEEEFEKHTGIVPIVSGNETWLKIKTNISISAANKIVKYQTNK